MENPASDIKPNNEPKNETKPEADPMVAAIGETGRWQMGLWALLIIPIRMSAAYQQLGIVFLAPYTSYICTETNLTDNVEVDTCYSDCVKYNYSSEFKNTIISEWDLICERAWLANFTQTMCMFGVLVGSFIFGYVADRYGRRKALLICCMLQLVTTLISPFCPSYWSFTAIRFFIGTSTAGTLLCSFILIIEIVGPMKREFMNCLCALPLPVGQMLMPLLAFLFRTWDYFSLAVAIPNLLYLLYFFVVPESPKWLISMGKIEEASEVMKSAAKWNKLPTDNMLVVAKAMANEKSDAPQVKASYMDLVKTRQLRINITCSCILWFILGISFYGSNQYIGQTSSNVYLTVFLAGALQLPGIMLSSVLCKKIGRKMTMMSFLGVCGISNAFLVVPEEWVEVRIVMGAFGVGCSSGAFATIYMYTSELFPTMARNMAMGASSTVSRVGSMLAPYVASLTIVAGWLPPVAFAVVPLIGVLTCIFLPETKGKKLADHVS